MAQPEQKFTSPASLLVDAILVIAFFIGIYLWVAPHVPSQDKTWIMVWAGLTASCLSGVFWLCIQMFRVVLRAQLAERRK
ncbi:MAG: hypothetical protein V4773_08020 [Verrucomicrobiota bacterium]